MLSFARRERADAAEVKKPPHRRLSGNYYDAYLIYCSAYRLQQAFRAVSNSCRISCAYTDLPEEHPKGYAYIWKKKKMHTVSDIPKVVALSNSIVVNLKLSLLTESPVYRTVYFRTSEQTEGGKKNRSKFRKHTYRRGAQSSEFLRTWCCRTDPEHTGILGADDSLYKQEGMQTNFQAIMQTQLTLKMVLNVRNENKSDSYHLRLTSRTAIDIFDFLIC